MTKELEALNKIDLELKISLTLFEDIFATCPEQIKENTNRLKKAIKLVPIIETALKRKNELEIENSKQFKEKWVQDNLAMTFELNVAKNKLKALEIIKELFNLRVYEKQGQFFICSGLNGETPISKEKAELLKEVLL